MLNTSLEISNLKTRNRVFLAPMSGITDWPFRKLAWEFGAALVVSEMIASAELCRERSKSKLRIEGNDIGFYSIQLAARDPYWIGEAARIAEENGAHLIDINMGCPAKKVVGGNSGAALMRDLPLAISLIESTVKAVKIPVSVKMRLGWDETDFTALELSKNAQESGASMITIHARTRQQFYKGKANWSKVKKLKDILKIPLVINGDIKDKKSALNALEESNADAVMVGRASYGAPWLAGEIAKEKKNFFSNQQFLDLILRHYDMILKYYGLNKGTKIAKKHLNWYFENSLKDKFHISLVEQKKMYQKLMDAKKEKEIKKIFQKIFV